MMSSESRYPCPSCSKNCWVNTIKGVYHCFHCDASGRVEELGLGAETALPEFCIDESDGDLGFKLPPYTELTDFAREYLLARGIEWWVLNNLPIFSVEDGILFPFEGWPYWQIRRWEIHGEPHWLDPQVAPSHAKDGVTYNIHGESHAKSNNGHRPMSRVILVEGIGDALKVASAGYNVAALLSSTLHDAQAETLSLEFEQAIVMLDADVPIGRFVKALDMAQDHFKEVDIALLRSGDPGGQSVELLREILG